MAVRTKWARAAEACVDGAALLSGRARRGGVVPARAGGNAGAKRGGAVAWRSRAQAERKQSERVGMVVVMRRQADTR
jgi:hypothetical protein